VASVTVAQAAGNQNESLNTIFSNKPSLAQKNLHNFFQQNNLRQKFP